MSYVNSKDVKLFPSSLRKEANDSTSKFTTEYNLTNIVNRIVDKQNYVISYSESETETGTTNIIKFNISGYYFELTIDEYLTNFTKDIYASIKLDNVELYINSTSQSGTVAIQNLVSQDSSSSFDNLDTKDTNDGVFTGLSLSETINTNSGYQSLHLLEKIDGSWVVPKNSYNKFSTEHIFNEIDSVEYNISTKFKSEDIYATNVNVDVVKPHHNSTNSSLGNSEDYYYSLHVVSAKVINDLTVDGDGEITAKKINTSVVLPKLNPGFSSTSIGNSEDYFDDAYFTNANINTLNANRINVNEITAIDSITASLFNGTLRGTSDASLTSNNLHKTNRGVLYQSNDDETSTLAFPDIDGQLLVTNSDNSLSWVNPRNSVEVRTALSLDDTFITASNPTSVRLHYNVTYLIKVTIHFTALKEISTTFSEIVNVTIPADSGNYNCYDGSVRFLKCDYMDSATNGGTMYLSYKLVGERIDNEYYNLHLKIRNVPKLSGSEITTQNVFDLLYPEDTPGITGDLVNYTIQTYRISKR